jgi:hypothetical protein
MLDKLYSLIILALTGVIVILGPDIADEPAATPAPPAKEEHPFFVQWAAAEAERKESWTDAAFRKALGE